MTLDAGRNDPCPCGSGKKFKRCCLARDAGAAFTAGEQEGVLARLYQFASRPELAGDRQAAEARFWGECAGDHPDARKVRAIELPQPQEAFDTWFALDVRLRSGRTPVGLFLERYGSRLARGEREYLERMRDTHLRPYQVTDLTPDGKARLIDLWTGDAEWVRESWLRRLVRWDLLAVRVVRGAEGDRVSDGLPYRYPLGARDALLRALRRAHAQFGCPRRPADVARFFKDVTMIFHHFWLATVRLGAALVPGGALAAPLVFSRALFHVRDREKVARAFARYRDLEDAGEGAWVWLADPLILGRALGRFLLEGERLVLETEAEGVVEHGRELLGRLAGDAIRFRGVKHGGVQLALGERGQLPVTYPDTVGRETVGSSERV